MQNNTLKVLSIVLGTSVLFTACDGLKKMIKKQDLITYDVTPKPLEMHADSVSISVSGKYPAKLFAKKAVVTVTPILKYNGTEKKLKPVVLVGEKATATGTKIAYEKGGTFSYTEKLAYEPEMKSAKLELQAQGSVKKKTKDFKNIELGDGTIATPLLVKNDEKTVLAKDAFVKSVPANQTSSIYYLVNQSTVRPSELKSDEVKKMMEFININSKNTVGYDFKSIQVSSYASPEGELSRNENLAKDRAKSGSEAMAAEFKKNKDITFGKDISKYSTAETAEDWEGFKTLMEQSSIADKELILRVLTMYKDGEQREKEIKNLSKTYKEVEEKILPKLRRSVLTVMIDKKSRTDEMINRLVDKNPDSLSVEELLYAATLTQDLNRKMNIYKSAEKYYANDWRTSNNLGVTYLMSNKVDDAKAAFERAEKIASNNSTVLNNLGAAIAKKGDRKLALSYFEKAGSLPEATYNKGIVSIRDGKYSEAVSQFGSNKGFNLALAQLLAGNAESVNSTIDASNEKDMAISHYLKAVAAARKGDSKGLDSLKTAIEKDASLKAVAKDDCEFLKWRNEEQFKTLVN
jgi:tetratricopeptide (TPR) repeat protein